MTLQTQQPGAKVAPGEFDELCRHLVEQSQHCVRPPVDRFRHPWLAPMPLSPAGEAYLRARGQGGSATGSQLSREGTGDGFKAGDYSLGLFHHDASEASIELLLYPSIRAGAAGALLCLLDGASPDGCVHRAELSHKSREFEPSKPVLAQYALRVAEALGQDGPAWLRQHRVYSRIEHFLRYLEERYTGLHGLMLTHSSLASGFDTDLLTAGLPDKTVEGPDTSAFMFLEYQAMAELCRRLGLERAEASRWEEKAERLRDLMERLLWYEDARGGFYLALRWQHGVGSLEGEIIADRDLLGRVVPLESWTTLLPLYAGIPSPSRAERMFERLLNPEMYWGPYGVRTVPADSPYFNQAPRVMMFDFKKNGRGPVSNWTGPIWILSNYYLAQGLSRYGRKAEARELTIKTARLLARGLERDGGLRECYDDAGRGLWPKRGTFLSWSVLALTLLREHAPEALPKQYLNPGA